ncbi:hypothetical protein ABID21_001925 [Pseudorhizobium tarimense]|uniref:Uncharacterized protein n=1 Tax=Pseudorhizobium tarimense TaxID=1079109 RepID=A0ABV2H5J2_9HYPH|nr:hypothetical protein [Pseudorhizobium tarimense]
MSEKPPLTDDQVHAKLGEAWNLLARESGSSEFGNNVLATARKVLFTLQAALVKRSDDAKAQDDA